MVDRSHISLCIYGKPLGVFVLIFVVVWILGVFACLLFSFGGWGVVVVFSVHTTCI